MLPHKKYIDIQAFQTKFADAFEVGDIIQITEKCDGSNCSIQYNPETNELETGVACIIPSNDVEYYTIQTAKVSYKKMKLTFTEL